jgi:peptidyl-prolyl cis-trans isomerase A (cyclophilin A)
VLTAQLAGAILAVALFAVDVPPLAKPASYRERAPQTYEATFETSKGPIVIEVHRDWAPLGADRFYNLVKSGYYDDCRFFRVIDSVLAQTGMHGNPSVQSAWDEARIPDDPLKASNKRGYVSLAQAGPQSRATQFFINLADNSATFDRRGFAPIGVVVSGMSAADQFYSGYGDGAPRGVGPPQTRIATGGNPYLAKEFPKLDYIKRATIEK